MQCAAIKTRTLFFSRQLRQLHNWNVWIELINNWNSLSDHRAINTYLGNFFLIIFLQWKSTKNRNDYFLCCQSVHIMCTNVNTFFFLSLIIWTINIQTSWPRARVSVELAVYQTGFSSIAIYIIKWNYVRFSSIDCI